MQVWHMSCRGGVVWGWGGACRGRVGGTCRGEVGWVIQGWVKWVIQRQDGVGHEKY